MFIKISKNNETADEFFSKSVYCAKTCIESVLSDFDAIASIDGSVIKITASGITENDCKEKIKGCFCDSSGVIYPEFLRVEVFPQKVS